MNPNEAVTVPAPWDEGFEYAIMLVETWAAGVDIRDPKVASEIRDLAAHLRETLERHRARRTPST